MRGAGGILHFSESHSLSFSTGLGEAMNNYNELMTLHLLLLLSLERKIRKMKIFGFCVCNKFMKGIDILRYYSLLPVL